MLEYSGTLLHGLRRAGLDDVFDALWPLTCDPDCGRRWSGSAARGGTPWPPPPRCRTTGCTCGLAAPLRRHLRPGALGRVRGFSPAEMALPNHPDVAYAFVKTLNDCGYPSGCWSRNTPSSCPTAGRWSAPTCPTVSAAPARAGHRRDRGRGQDPGQRHQAGGPDAALLRGQGPVPPRSRPCRVPPLVTQVADGENGGVMMNEFPQVPRGRPRVLRLPDADPECHRVPGAARHRHPASRPAAHPAAVPAPHLAAAGTRRRPRPARRRHRAARREDSRFHVEGGSWTSDLSWVRGYDQVLVPMEQASALFHERILARWRPQRRSPLPQGPVPPAGGRDELLPLLGQSGPTTAPSYPAVSPSSSAHDR